MADPPWKDLTNIWTKYLGDKITDLDWDDIRSGLANAYGDLAEKVYVPGGAAETVKDAAQDALGTSDISQITEQITAAIRSIMQNPETIEVSELLGALITEPFVSLLEDYGDRDDYSAVEFSRAFHGATTLLTLVRLVLAAIETSVLGFKVGPVSEAFGSVYWNLGLGFLGWQTLAPLLSAGLQPKLTRYYNKRYEPNVFDLDSQVIRYNLGQIGASELIQVGRELGWSVDKINTVIEHGYRSLTRSDMVTLYQAGEISIQEIRAEFIKSGFNPRYVATLATDMLQETKADDRLPSLSTARKAYREGYYSTGQFTKLLQSMGYGSEAIQVEIALAHQALQQERRELTLSQIKQAFGVGEVSETEVRNYLQSEGYEQTQILILLNTWNAAKKPRILKLNKGSITTALRNGVLNAGEAGLRLRDLGYTPEDAKIIVDTALASGGVSGHTISISKLLQAFGIGAITQSDLTTRLQARGVTNADIQIYIAVALHEDIQPLTNQDVRQAFLYGVLDSNGALTHLRSLDYSQADAQLLVQTWQRQRESFSLKLTPGLAILYYRQGLLSSDQLRRKLLELGFSQDDAGLMVQSADLAYPRELTSNEIQDLYLTSTINEGRAVQLLQQTGLDGGSAQLLVKSWSSALGDIRPQPTVSQYLAAFRNELITENEFSEKLRSIGYDDQSIAFYIRLAGEVEIEVTKTLTKADVLGLYDDELIPYTNALERLIEMGYSADDSELLLARRKPTIKDSQAHKLFMAGYINPEFYVEILLGLGFTPDDVDEYLTDIGY